MNIGENYKKIRETVPEYVTIVLACKKRTPDEVAQVIKAGATHLGGNYVQETEKLVSDLKEMSGKVKWHMIGSLQKNKINKALKIFDTIQTVHSVKQAEQINKRAEAAGKKIDVLMEINIGKEAGKSGLPPDWESVKKLGEGFSGLNFLSLKGIMTMGPFWGDPEALRPFFRETKKIYDRLKDLNLPYAKIKYLSMGMSDSYKVAIEEGSNMIRLGTIIFGPRT